MLMMMMSHIAIFLGLKAIIFSSNSQFTTLITMEFSHFYLVTLISLFFKLLFFQNYIQIENQRIINWQVGDHVSFVPETGALLLRSVSFRDSGDYLCLVNNKRENGQVRLMVQGKILFFLSFIHLFTLVIF